MNKSKPVNPLDQARGDLLLTFLRRPADSRTPNLLTLEEETLNELAVRMACSFPKLEEIINALAAEGQIAVEVITQRTNPCYAAEECDCERAWLVLRALDDEGGKA